MVRVRVKTVEEILETLDDNYRLNDDAKTLFFAPQMFVYCGECHEAEEHKILDVYMIGGWGFAPEWIEFCEEKAHTIDDKRYEVLSYINTYLNELKDSEREDLSRFDFFEVVEEHFDNAIVKCWYDHDYSDVEKGLCYIIRFLDE